MITIKNIFSLLTTTEQRHGLVLLGMILIMALLDAVGVASIMPFVAVLGNPDVIETNRWLAYVNDWLGYENSNDFLFFLGIVLFVTLVGSIAFKALTQYAILRFSHMRNHSLACRLFKGYLGRQYSWFLNRHSADLGKTILSEVGQVVNDVLMPCMELLAHGIVALFLVVLLLLVDPVLASTVIIVLGGFYLIIYISVRSYLSRIGTDRLESNRERFQIAQEALAGIKEVKIFGREDAFLNRFAWPSLRFARHKVNSHVAGMIPSFALQIIAFGGMLVIVLYLLRSTGDLGTALPLVALYALAGNRLLPALQMIYQSLTRLRFGIPAMEALRKDMQEIEQGREAVPSISADSKVPGRLISLRSVSFTYPGAQALALNNLCLEIPVQSTIGLVGTTGAGKTTTVDLILGLLFPEKGGLFVDDAIITPSNVRSWQNVLGYVPQQIYLADDSVAGNIAFGIDPGDIDYQAVERAARIAELHSFVSKELPRGYKTMVGERGVRLSGGQRQRIGIARALYHDPAVIIFDEATSALDNITEKAVMTAVNKLGGQKTIILIAHRFLTVRNCDIIYLLEWGRVVGKGTYEELLENCGKFRAMAGKN